MEICLFEDQHYERLEPLTYTRPVYNLFCGINTLRRKIARAYPEIRISLHTRPYLEDFLVMKKPGYKINSINSDDCLFFNGKIIAPQNINEIIPLSRKENKVFVHGDTLIAARVSGKKLDEIIKGDTDVFNLATFDGIPTEQVEVKYVEYVWDLVNNNHTEIVNDFNYLVKARNITDQNRFLGKIHDGVHIIEKSNVFVDEGAIIYPGVVIDATKGPVVIDRNAKILPNAVLIGPVYIGEGSMVNSGAYLYESVTVGKVCKVGGEIEDSIISPYTNKQHSGFLGHAYLGSWVNLGADTNCSDLKNNYGTVKVYVNGEMVDSHSQFVGLIMGDHSKAAINTMFNTGTVVGFNCNIFGADFPPKYIPSFSWGGSGSLTTYDLERAVETSKRVVQRRNRTIDAVEEKLFRKVFELTQKERRKRGYPY